jgi:hypothetical protein
MPECQLVIRDEVNVKIEGLDANLRRKLTNHFKYEVPGARYLPAVRLGRWDGKVSYFSLAGATYINLLPDIIPMLEDAGYDIDIEDTRNYRTHYDLKSVTETSFSHRNWPEGHPQAGEPILLRDYQCDIINRFMSNPQSIQEVATGAGKCLAGDTRLSIEIDETSAFGKFIINKLQLEQDNDVTRDNKKF